MGWKKSGAVLAVFICFFTLTEVKPCLAIPAFARKYDAPCHKCHRPNIPRLNVTGHTFRKLGYRFPEEVGKKPDYKEIGQYLAMQVRANYTYMDSEDIDTVSQFELNNATLFYAGPVTENLSGFVELEWDDTDEIELMAHISWLFGTADRYLNVRGGQMHTLVEEGWGGFDRPSGISATNLFTEKLTDSPVPFRVGQAQKGIELAFGPNRDARIIAQILNGLNFEGEGTGGSADDDTDKDVMLAYEQIVDSKGSGFTLYAYRGVWHQEPGTVVNGITLPKEDRFTEFNFYRYGATASILFDIIPAGYSEILGGAIWSWDNFPDDYPIHKDNMRGQAYFVELEQYLIEEDASIFARTDFIERDTRKNDWINRYTIGSAYMPVHHLRLAVEVFAQDVQNQDKTFGGIAEAMLNF